MFYLITILFGVVWILMSIIINYNSTKSPISHKYLNHGIHVPVHNNSNSISRLLAEAGRMMKVFSASTKFLFKNTRVTSWRALENFLIGKALFIYILGAIVFQIGALFTPVVFSLFALSLPLSVNSSNEDKPEKFYENADTKKKLIIKENKNKSGIYRWTNKSTGDFYIGQSINLSARFINYYNISYLASKNHLIICRALIKYG